ncbi:unnamed protein product [Paramecium primaurelia]|uniref:Uncharacterized protein n=1 Tax=Paramecium primaurelia TaxID=5886 RepID=A0A8S1MEY1_PARPR|nr:unnamed protein product [Paramecium primaurelia]
MLLVNGQYLKNKKYYYSQKVELKIIYVKILIIILIVVIKREDKNNFVHESMDVVILFRNFLKQQTLNNAEILILERSSSQEKEYIYIPDIFDYNNCREEDCLFTIYTSCPEFINGKRGFLNSKQCTQCSYQINPKDCIATKQCT